jgi:hypothetical protein
MIDRTAARSATASVPIGGFAGVSLHPVGDGRADRILDAQGYVGRWFANDYDKLPEGALVSDATTLSWLGLRDKGWFCEEPHYKGTLLHLRHKVFQAKDVNHFRSRVHRRLRQHLGQAEGLA